MQIYHTRQSGWKLLRSFHLGLLRMGDFRHAKAEAADRAYISALYNDIVFGCAMPGFESYSNPMLMMRRLAKQGAKPVFHLGENPLIRQMFGTERGRQAGSRTNEDVWNAL